MNDLQLIILEKLKLKGWSTETYSDQDNLLIVDELQLINNHNEELTRLSELLYPEQKKVLLISLYRISTLVNLIQEKIAVGVAFRLAEKHPGEN